MLIVNVCLCLHADMLECAVLEMRQILAQCVLCKSLVNVIFTTCAESSANLQYLPSYIFIHERFFLSFDDVSIFSMQIM